MNIFSRIGIGCANFDKEYNGAKVPDKDVDKIYGYCQCCGIDLLDMATAYGNDFSRANSYFNKIIKVRKGDDIESVIETQPYAILAHDIEEYRNGLLYPWHGDASFMRGASIYAPGEHLDIYGGSIVELPYSLYDRRFEPYLESIHEGNEVHVRSIFLRGRIIQDGMPAEECIKFVLANPFIDKIIIGADSFDQLRWNLDFIVKWNNLEKHDNNLLDPRKWR